ncbi:MAG: hypothetical protein ACRELD_03325 [Longimicrobiales bacterium]
MPVKTKRRRVRDGTRMAGQWALLLAVASGCQPRMVTEPLAPAEIETTLLLIGDAGEPDPHEVGAPLDSLEAQAMSAAERTIILFLGDNVYPEGLPEEGHAEWADSRRRLEAQVSAVPHDARGIFLPGNHDWAGETAFGLYSIRLQERLIAELAAGRDVRMLPGNGCPGPVTVDVGRLRLVMFDTQWWLHEYIVRDADSDCTGNFATVTAALREQIRTDQDGRVVVVAGHHPLMTGGSHGGYCSTTGPFRRFGGRTQDIISKPNRTLRDSIEAAFSAQPPLVYAAGHDHNLQVLRGGPSVAYLLVSGAGSDPKTSCAVRLRESYFNSQNRSGFMRLDILRGRGVLLRVFHYAGDGTGGLAYSRWLEPR